MSQTQGSEDVSVGEVLQWVCKHGLGTRFWFHKAHRRVRLVTNRYGPILEGDSISEVCEIVRRHILVKTGG